MAKTNLPTLHAYTLFDGTHAHIRGEDDKAVCGSSPAIAGGAVRTLELLRSEIGAGEQRDFLLCPECGNHFAAKRPEWGLW